VLIGGYLANRLEIKTLKGQIDRLVGFILQQQKGVYNVGIGIFTYILATYISSRLPSDDQGKHFSYAWYL
jgi:hypothetical protein